MPMPYCVVVCIIIKLDVVRRVYGLAEKETLAWLRIFLHYLCNYTVKAYDSGSTVQQLFASEIKKNWKNKWNE